MTSKLGLKPWVPLWKRLVKKLPLHVKGDPQIRVFFTEFWMKFVKPERKMPPDYVQFAVHPQMTINDVRQHLEKIYHVSVNSIRIENRRGKTNKHPFFGYDVPPDPDIKYAYVQLKESTFEWPDIFDGEITPQEKQVNDLKKQQNLANKDFVKSWDKQDIPAWFR